MTDREIRKVTLIGDKEIARKISEDNERRERAVWAVINAVRRRTAKVPDNDFVKAFLEGVEVPNVMWFGYNGAEYLIRADRAGGEIGFKIIVTFPILGDEFTTTLRYDFPRGLNGVIKEYVEERSKILGAIRREWYID